MKLVPDSWHICKIPEKSLRAGFERGGVIARSCYETSKRGTLRFSDVLYSREANVHQYQRQVGAKPKDNRPAKILPILDSSRSDDNLQA
jgi:hypothetical protein